MTAAEARRLAGQMTAADQVRQEIDKQIRLAAEAGKSECTVESPWGDVAAQGVTEGLMKDGFTVKARWLKIPGDPAFTYEVGWALPFSFGC